MFYELNKLAGMIAKFYKVKARAKDTKYKKIKVCCINWQMWQALRDIAYRWRTPCCFSWIQHQLIPFQRICYDARIDANISTAIVLSTQIVWRD